MLRWFDTDVSHKALAIVSAERKEGRSFIAANLAIVFSQLGEHTLLVDADLRNPSQHQLFGLDNRSGLSALLTGRAGHDAIQRIPALRDLFRAVGRDPPAQSVRTAGAAGVCATAEGNLPSQFDVLILDTAAASDSTDAQTVAICANGALIVARKDVSRFGRVRAVAEHALQTSATIVGTVLNDF